MDEKIFIRVKYSADDYARVSSFMRRQAMLNKFGFVIIFVSIFFTIALFTFILANDKETINYQNLIIASFLPSFLASGFIYLLDKILVPSIMKRNFEKQIKSSPMLNEENNICFSSEEFEISNELYSQKIKWEGVIKALESETDFVLYTANNAALFFPKTAFVYESDANFLRCMSRAKLADKAKL